MRTDSTKEIVNSREEELIKKFPAFLSYYDNYTPFTSPGQLNYHRLTIKRRRELGSIRAAVLNGEFVRNLWFTLKAWGMNRGSLLLPLTEFSNNLKNNLSDLESLELYHIEDTKLRDEDKANQIWELINQIKVSKSKNKVVS